LMAVKIVPPRIGYGRECTSIAVAIDKHVLGAMTQRIEDYALIGDCESAALVGRNGSIDWLCWPRFDSGAVFAALLGEPHNGHWSITAADPEARISRSYRQNTLILETLIETSRGAVTVIDFMPLKSGGTSHLVRLVCGMRGSMRMMTEFVIRFDYGSIVPWVTRLGDTSFKAIAGPDMVVLRTNVLFRAEGYKHHGTFLVGAGECVAFVLAYGASYRPPPEPIDAIKALKQTAKVWVDWASQYNGVGTYSDAVVRSLLTLKALTYQPTGGIVAAPTTSLPEVLGGIRNWDYRYCWLRDATFTLLALIDSGFYDEAADWRAWLRRAVAGSPAQVQIMYGLAGERRLNEWEVPCLPGYGRSRPVRIGNAAANQLQLDVFGEVLDALYQGSTRGLVREHSGWDLQCRLIEHLESVWRQPDEGIWEVRGGRRHFTHSKVMAWVAFDRAIKSVEQFGFDAPVARWRKARAEVHRQVCRHGYDASVGAFVQYYGTTELDASALLIPLVGFLPPTDGRVRSTVRAIERRLMVDGLVARYDPRHTEDGLRCPEGAFLACSFWLADNLVLLGRYEEARALFERLLALRNDVGLLSEEYDTRLGRMLGNYPQAFSHVALINTAHNLCKHEKPAEQRSGSKPEAVADSA
jgi:GH15 family glucan-1,4-alpha-glucosidase